jgi:hypothetical protein
MNGVPWFGGHCYLAAYVSRILQLATPPVPVPSLIDTLAAQKDRWATGGDWDQSNPAKMTERQRARRHAVPD